MVTKTSWILLLFLVTSAVLLTGVILPGKAGTTIVVPDDYATIQWAVANASDGDTIFVRPGIYRETVVVNRSLSIVGENRNETIVDGGGVGYVFRLTATNIVLTNLTIQGGGCCANSAIILLDSNNSQLVGNLIRENAGTAILVTNSYNCTFTGNDLVQNERGIRLANSHDNKFYHNNFIYNTIQVSIFYSGNQWDTGYPSGGNYWSDYTGSDTDQDGIGDTPYIIDANNRDAYPLMEPWIPPPSVADGQSAGTVLLFIALLVAVALVAILFVGIVVVRRRKRR